MGERQATEPPHTPLVGTTHDPGLAFTAAIRALERKGRHPLNRFGFEKSPTPQQMQALFASVSYFPRAESTLPAAASKESQNAIIEDEYANFLANPLLTTPRALARAIIAKYAMKGTRPETIIAQLNSIATAQASPSVAELIIAQIINYGKIRISQPISYDAICQALMESGKGGIVEWLESSGLNLKIVNEFGPSKEEIRSMDESGEQTLTEFVHSALNRFLAQNPSEPNMSLVPTFEYLNQTIPELEWRQFISCIQRLARSGALDFTSTLHAKFTLLTQQLKEARYDEIKIAVRQKGFMLDTTIKIVALASAGVDIPTIRWYIGASTTSNFTLKERIERLIYKGLIPRSYLASPSMS